MKVLYKFDLMQIAYCENSKMLQVNWENYITSEDYTRAMRELLRLTLSLDIENWLIDGRASDELQTANFSWPIDYVCKALAKSRLKKIAWLIAPERLTEKDLIHFMDGLKHEFNLQFESRAFDTETKALDWLRNTEPAKEDNLPNPNRFGKNIFPS